VDFPTALLGRTRSIGSEASPIKRSVRGTGVWVGVAVATTAVAVGVWVGGGRGVAVAVTVGGAPDGISITA
jgi:hypothetical protein